MTSDIEEVTIQKASNEHSRAVIHRLGFIAFLAYPQHRVLELAITTLLIRSMSEIADIFVRSTPPRIPQATAA
jgi:hypothetical protein